jgi:hypothetical protein
VLLKLSSIEGQVNRLVSDAESEKEVRRRITIDFEGRLRTLESRIWRAQGAGLAFGLISIILSIIVAVIKL